MRGSFFNFRIATSGMHTARANLSVTAHNMANMGIPGFSRQVTVQSALPAIHLRNGRGMYGTGSIVHNVIQLRDQFIDRRYWHQQGILGEFSVKVPQLSLIEVIFNDLPENSTVGVLGAFNGFFANMQSLSVSSNEPTFRSNVVGTGESLATLIRTNAEALQQQQRDVNGEVRAVVTEINSLGRQITTLNHQIRQFEFDGSHANDLRDQRALLLDRLSGLVNIQVEERDFSATSGIENDRRLLVSINGEDFINNDTVHVLELVPRTSDQRRNEMDVDGLYNIRFASGSPFDIYNRHLRGALKGLIDIRDGNGNNSTKVRVSLIGLDLSDSTNIAPGFWPTWLTYEMLPPNFDSLDPNTWPPFINIHPWQYDPPILDANGPLPPGVFRVATTNYKGIPFYMNRLNDMVRVFVRAVNDGQSLNPDGTLRNINGSPGHRNGWSLTGTTGLGFFTWIDFDGNIQGYDSVGDFNFLNALNFNINQTLVRYPQRLQCSSAPNIGQSDNAIVQGFIFLNNYRSLFREGRLLDFVIATAGHLAIDLNQAKRFRHNYHEMSIATQNQRAAISDVDMNEELLNMARFNHLFQVNARMISTMNDVYDTLINRLGIG